MAKKNKVSGEVPAETPEGEDLANEAVDTPVVEGKAKGAPRARKWNYGIVMEATVSAVDGAAAPKGAIQGHTYLADGPVSVQDFSANVDDWRHALRVLLRGKAAIITGVDGTVYPLEYDHAAAAAARETKAALKKAKEAQEQGEEVEA